MLAVTYIEFNNLGHFHILDAEDWRDRLRVGKKGIGYIFNSKSQTGSANQYTKQPAGTPECYEPPPLRTNKPSLI